LLAGFQRDFGRSGAIVLRAMSSRLQELLRQKSLLAEHAAWLDREIAREQVQPASTPAPEPPAASEVLPAVEAAPVLPEPAIPEAESNADLDAQAAAIIEQYRNESQVNRQRIQVGCVLYLVAALILAALPFVAVYLYHHW
jgi:hypothetical protein